MGVVDTVQLIVDDRYQGRYMVTKSVIVSEVLDKDDENLGKKLIVSTDGETALWDFVGMVTTVAHDMLEYYAAMEPEYPPDE